MRNIVLFFSYLDSEYYEALYSKQQGLDFVYSYKTERRQELCGNQIDLDDIQY